MASQNYDATLAQIAGTIASGLGSALVMRGFMKFSDEQKTQIVADSVTLAQQIIEECRLMLTEGSNKPT